MLYRHNKILKRKVGKTAHLFFVLWIFLPINVFAQQTTIPSELEKTYIQVLKLKIQEKEIELKGISLTSAMVPLSIYTENLADILELLLTEDASLYLAKKELEKQRLGRLEALDDKNPYKRFTEAELKLQWAFVKLKFGDELSAVWNFKQAYSIITINEGKFPQFLPNNKTSGLLNIIFGAVPPKYNWLLSLLGLTGSTPKGIKQLTELANSNHFLSLEGKIMLDLTNMYLANHQHEATSSFINLGKEHEDNKLIQYLLATILIKNHKAEEALRILQKVKVLNEGFLSIEMTDYLSGEIYLEKGDYNKAIENYASFLLHYKGVNFIKDANYKMFLAYWLSGDKKMAATCFNQAKITGATSAEADKYANKQVLSGKYPNSVILKIRLATDGGYYQKANELIEKYKVEDFNSYEDKVEFIYRKARLLHQQGEEKAAIPYYLKTIEKAGDNPWYYAPNAALQLGYIYTAMNNREKASSFFKKALSYKDHEYKNSIDNKAEIGLQDLEKEQ